VFVYDSTHSFVMLVAEMSNAAVFVEDHVAFVWGRSIANNAPRAGRRNFLTIWTNRSRCRFHTLLCQATASNASGSRETPRQTPGTPTDGDAE
jgi:hypothetical protein